MANKSLNWNTNTISEGFVGGSNSSSSRRKYARQVLATNVISHGFPIGAWEKAKVNITFFKEDALRVNPHDNNCLLITVQHVRWDIKWVLIDTSSSDDALFWDAFKKLYLYPNDVKVFNSSLTWFSIEHVQVMGHVTLKTICFEGTDTKEADVRYFIMNALSTYNIILG